MTTRLVPLDDRIPPHPIADGVRIGHVHLKVANLDRALAFYCDVLGFELTQRAAARRPSSRPAAIITTSRSTPGRASAARPRRRLDRPLSPGDPLSDAGAAGRCAAPRAAAGIALDGASDHGVSEALYLRDSDGNGVELYWDRPREAWPVGPDGHLDMGRLRLDLQNLLAER